MQIKFRFKSNSFGLMYGLLLIEGLPKHLPQTDFVITLGMGLPLILQDGKREDSY